MRRKGDRLNTTPQPALNTAGQFDYTLKKQGGGPGQYARVFGYLESCEEGLEFENRVTGGTIPTVFIRACEQGFRDAATSGVVAGYPVIGVRVVLEGGHFHPVDSNEQAFRYAACQAFYQGMHSADPVILEPVMQVEVAVPVQFVGVVQGDLQSKRAKLTGLEFVGDAALVQAETPLAQLFGYTTRLRSLCSGKGEFSMSFSHYQPVSEALQQQLMAR